MAKNRYTDAAYRQGLADRTCCRLATLADDVAMMLDGDMDRCSSPCSLLLPGVGRTHEG